MSGGDEIDSRDRRFAEVVSQMVMARVLSALHNSELGDRVAARLEAGADRVVARVVRRLVGYVLACALGLVAVQAGVFDSWIERLSRVMIENQDVARHLPGLIGSLAAMLWIKDTWPRRLGYMLAGAAASYYVAPTAATAMGADLGFAGFLVGLFGMAVAAKTFESLEALAAKEVVSRIFKRLGL